MQDCILFYRKFIFISLYKDFPFYFEIERNQYKIRALTQKCLFIKIYHQDKTNFRSRWRNFFLLFLAPLMAFGLWIFWWEHFIKYFHFVNTIIYILIIMMKIFNTYRFCLPSKFSWKAFSDSLPKTRKKKINLINDQYWIILWFNNDDNQHVNRTCATFW